MLKTAKLFYFCHLKKLVRPETFAPCHVPLVSLKSVTACFKMINFLRVISCMAFFVFVTGKRGTFCKPFRSSGLRGLE